MAMNPPGRSRNPYDHTPPLPLRFSFSARRGKAILIQVDLERFHTHKKGSVNVHRSRLVRVGLVKTRKFHMGGE